MTEPKAKGSSPRKCIPRWQRVSLFGSAGEVDEYYQSGHHHYRDGDEDVSEPVDRIAKINEGELGLSLGVITEEALPGESHDEPVSH